jgi:hypothetical protein
MQAEQDNSAIRDLQYLQASMLWLDIGAFCGYKRKMEIAESSLQGLVTVLYPLIYCNSLLIMAGTSPGGKI